MAGLPPPPLQDAQGSFGWLEWYRQLRDYLSTASSIPWNIIQFAGSKLTDLQTRLHGDLQSIQGGIPGERYHLTAAQLATVGTTPNVDYIDFSKTATVTDQEARLTWNNTDKTLNLGMDYSVTQQIGLETYARVQNNTGVTIPNGTVVGFAGAGVGSALSVAPYLANGSSSTLYVVGIMTHDLPDTGTYGYCTVWGAVRDLNTSSYSLGDILYASPTVAGGLTKTKPTAPNSVVPLAAVIKVGTTDGVIFVRPTIEQQRYYGEFTKTTNQSPAAINTAYALTFDNTEIALGVSIGTPASRLVISSAGLYSVTLSVQVTSTSASQKAVWLWLKKNGTTNIANSAKIATIALNGGYLVITTSGIESLVAGDYLEVMYASDSTAITIATVAATAFAPASPAAIVAITQTHQ